MRLSGPPGVGAPGFAPLPPETWGHKLHPTNMNLEAVTSMTLLSPRKNTPWGTCPGWRGQRKAGQKSQDSKETLSLSSPWRGWGPGSEP